VADPAGFSPELLKNRIAKVSGALDRIALGKRRVQSVLDRHIVAHRRTLEQKISEQGPKDQRIDPHLLGFAITDLVAQNRLIVHHHMAAAKTDWYANPLAQQAVINTRLDVLAPLHAEATSKPLTNLVGEALELVVFKALKAKAAASPRYSYQGHFDLAAPKDDFGHYKKVKPLKYIHGNVTKKDPDFLQFGHDTGPLCIECKNYREWFYPHWDGIKTLIIRAAELEAVPVLIARRLHYSMIRNFLEPAGIIAHETYNQYYPGSHAALAEQVRDRDKLGFTDVLATEEPEHRVSHFIDTTLPNITDYMGARWRANKDALVAYARDEIVLAQLYNAINSPAAGNWHDPEPEEENPGY
jgi:hypothetical protein